MTALEHFHPDFYQSTGYSKHQLRLKNNRAITIRGFYKKLLIFHVQVPGKINCWRISWFLLSSS